MAQVQVESKGAVQVVRLQRAEKKNAITVAMYDALADALLAADRDESVRVALLLGAPGIFSAGNDVLDFLQNPPAGDDSAVFRFLAALTQMTKPIVAGVDGAAIGIGTTMLLHCDLVVASPRARFQLPFVNLGLVPEAASSVLLPALVGHQRAAEWLLLGDAFDAEAAQRAGLVNRVVAPEEVETTAMGLCDALAARPPEAVRLTKRLMREPTRAAIDAAFRREGDLFVERLRSPEAMQAFAAFMGRK